MILVGPAGWSYKDWYGKVYRESEQVFVISNTHFEGKAVANAAMPKAQIHGAPAPVPPTVFNFYRDVLQALATPI